MRKNDFVFIIDSSVSEGGECCDDETDPGGAGVHPSRSILPYFPINDGECRVQDISAPSPP